MVSYASISQKGDREYNEDSVQILKSGDDFLFGLADGLGGHGNGDVASQTALAALAGWESDDICSSVAACFERAQRAVLDRKASDENIRKMMTTMVLLEIEHNKILWGHVGDSRLYYFLDGKLECRTLDHSVPQILVSTGEIDETQIRHHPDRNRILRSIGTEWDKPSYQLGEPLECQGKQQLLLCSDGFWEHIVEEEMERTLQHSLSPRQWLRKMERIVRKNGHEYDMDNYSAVAVWLKS